MEIYFENTHTLSEEKAAMQGKGTNIISQRPTEQAGRPLPTYLKAKPAIKSLVKNTASLNVLCGNQ